MRNLGTVKLPDSTFFVTCEFAYLDVPSKKSEILTSNLEKMTSNINEYKHKYNTNK